MEPKYRHEYKYLISAGQVALLRSRISGLMRPDGHTGPGGGYNIRSLYFDDYDDRCLYENEDGVDPRAKFRIRIYNHSDGRITLERKHKVRGKTLKESCPLTLAQTQSLMAGRVPEDFAAQPPLLRALTVDMMNHGMTPKIIVEYDRIPYVYPYGNVRVTFDLNISSAPRPERFLQDAIPKRPVLPVGMQLLEVKFDEYLPDPIYNALQLGDLQQTAFSKYFLCRKYTI